MAAYKSPGFADRAAAARDAKQRALEQLRAKPAPDPAVLAERQAVREAREAREAERRAAKLAAEQEAKAAAAAARAEAEAAAAAAAAAEAEAEAERAAKVRPQLTEAERKAARDARYAARKSRKR